MVIRARSSRLHHGLLVLALALSGMSACKRGESKPRPGCDQAKLAALAERLDAASPDAQVALVSAGLLDACEGSLHSPIEAMFTGIARPDDDLPLSASLDPRFAAARERICPNHAKLTARLAATPVAERALVFAEVCGFDRFELLDADDLRALGSTTGVFTFVMHDALLTQGTPPAIAKTISRAVVATEMHTFSTLIIQPLPEQKLVALPAATPPPEGSVVYLSTTRIVFQERPVVGLDGGALRPDDVAGHVVTSLHEDLGEDVEKAKAIMETRGETWDGLLLLAADARVPVSTLIDVLFTSGRLGYRRFGFVVQPTHPILRAILVMPPQFGAESPPSFRVFISDEGYHLNDRNGERVTVAKLDPRGTDASAWDQAGLVAAAREAIAANPELRRAAVAAENDISTEVLLTTYAALLGPGCDQREPSGCLLPELGIEAGAG